MSLRTVGVFRIDETHAGVRFFLLVYLTGAFIQICSALQFFSMFLCGLFKGEGKIAELTANCLFCMDAHSKSEILFKNPYALVHQMNYTLFLNRKGWEKILLKLLSPKIYIQDE